MSKAERNYGVIAIVIGLIAIAISGYALMSLPSKPHTYPSPFYKPATRHLAVNMIERNIWSSEITEEENYTEPEIVGKFRRWRLNAVYAFLGDTVVLTVKNEAQHVHSFVLPAFNVDTGDLAPLGGEKTVTFIVDREGVFEFECGVPYDRGNGRCDPDHARQIGYMTVYAMDVEYEEETG